MCNLIICNKEIGENRNLKDVLRIQFDDFYTQKHGMGIMTVDENGNVDIKKELLPENYWNIYSKMLSSLDKYKLVAIHSRTSTSGKINEENIHFFQEGDWIFAHNGWVMELAPSRVVKKQTSLGWYETTKRENQEKEYQRLTDIFLDCRDCIDSDTGFCTKHSGQFFELNKLEEKLYPEIQEELFEDLDIKKKDCKYDADLCDSYNFLKILCKGKTDLTEVEISKAVEKNSFHGIGFLYNQNKQKGFLIAHKKIAQEAIYNDDFLICSSYKLEMKGEKVIRHNVRGINLLSTEDVNLQELFEKFKIEEGIYTLKI